MTQVKSIATEQYKYLYILSPDAINYIMSKLKDFYVKKQGCEYDRIETSLRYLSQLAGYGAREVNDYLLGKNQSFEHVQELAGILEKYQLKDTDTILTLSQFPYPYIWDAVRKKSDKELRWISELALEMRLLRYELNDIPNNSQKLKELCSLLCDISNDFLNERYEYRHYLAA